MPLAPNVLPTIQRVFSDHPEINTTVEGERGRITDYVVGALGGFPWGRKDRDQNPANNNNSDDALCFRLSDGRFEIYDIINGTNGQPTFNYSGTFRDGENGFFREVPLAAPAGPDPVVVPGSGNGGVPDPVVVPITNLGDVIAAIEAASAANVAKLDELKVAVIRAAREAGTSLLPLLLGFRK